MSRNFRRGSKGTALLAVLWLTAALSAIAFSIADTVRAEIERGITMQESTQAYYLARGAIQRAAFIMRNSDDGGGASPAERFASRRRIYFQEELGDTLIEFISERGKLPLRSLNPQLLYTLLVTLGESPDSAADIVRQAFSVGAPQMASSSQNLQSFSAFRPSFASMENVEELLLVPGITTELLYGRYSRMPDGSLINLGGLADFLSPHLKESSGIDPLSVHPSLLVAMGMSPESARRFAEIRRQAFNPLQFFSVINTFGPGLKVGMRPDLGDIFQIRATARVRLPNGNLSQTRRSCALMVKYTTPNPRYFWISPWTHLRWYDQTFSDVAASNTVWINTTRPETQP
jgi:general secretion pathway protein K